jgi:hypothetical protein
MPLINPFRIPYPLYLLSTGVLYTRAYSLRYLTAGCKVTLSPAVTGIRLQASGFGRGSWRDLPTVIAPLSPLPRCVRSYLG